MDFIGIERSQPFFGFYFFFLCHSHTHTRASFLLIFIWEHELRMLSYYLAIVGAILEFLNLRRKSMLCLSRKIWIYVRKTYSDGWDEENIVERTEKRNFIVWSDAILLTQIAEIVGRWNVFEQGVNLSKNFHSICGRIESRRFPI